MINDKIIFVNEKITFIILLAIIFPFFITLTAKPLPNYSSTSDTILIGKYIDSSRFYLAKEEQEIDSSLYYVNKAHKLAEELNNDFYLYNIYRQYSTLFIDTRNYLMALEYSFKMLDLLEASGNFENDTELMDRYITLLASIGTCYFQIDSDLSLLYLEKAEEFASRNYDRLGNISFKLAAIYNDIGSVYLEKGFLDIALANYEKALFYLHNDNSEENFYTSFIFNNLGIIYVEQENYEEALKYYNKSLNIRKKENNKDALAQIYNNLGKYFYKRKQYNIALKYLDESMNLCKETNNYRSEIIGLRILSAIYNEQGNYRQEAIVNKRESVLKDSLFIIENRKEILQLKTRYEYEKQSRQNDLEHQIMLASKEKKRIFFIIIIGFLLFLFLILLLLIGNLKMKTKRDKLQADALMLRSKNLELEKQNLLLQNSKLEQEVESKSKELTTHVMYLVQKNEFILSVIDKLSLLIKKDSVHDSKLQMKSIIKQMKSNVDKTLWDEFEIRFQQVHYLFYSKLNKKIPNLTPNEKRLCAFLYLNMTTKEISSITFQSVKSIEVARTRLRKKMQIDRDENLISILQNL